MDLKKTPQADLENERTTFFLLGFTVVLATLFVLFEWSSEETLSPDWDGFSSFLIEEELAPLVPSAELSPEENQLKASPLEAPEEKNPGKAVYEDFNIVEQAPDVEEAISELFASVNQTEELPTPPSEAIQKVAETIYTEAEVMPQYPGGYTELARFLLKNINYPASAVSQRIQGRVWCSFVVNKDGSVTDIQLEQGVFISLDQEAMQVLKMMPPWVPGAIRGEAVRVKVYLPIVFHL
ncbi:MAG: TonB family protein [Candidatus Symbiothrix sp.]|jgi:protein TonB|nr:TonB family protein [Candidatus Symbiothrix sp.]